MMNVFKIYIFFIMLIVNCITLTSLMHCKSGESNNHSNGVSGSEKSKIIKNEKQAISKALELMQAQKYTEGIRLLQNFIQNKTPSFKSYYYLGQLYFDANDLESALTNAKKARELLANDVASKKGQATNQKTLKWLGECHFLIATIYKKLNKIDDAELFYNKSVKFYSKDAEALSNIATFYFENGKYKKSITYFNKALNNNPDLKNALLGMANTYDKLKNYSKAMIYYQLCIEKHPQEYSAYLRIGDIYLKKGEKDKGNLHLGKGYFLKGKFDKAVDTFKNIRRLDKKLEVLKVLISSLIQADEYSDALLYIRVGKRNFPKEEEFYYDAFQVYYRQKLNEIARSELDKGLKVFPNSKLLNIAMATLLTSQNEKENAVPYYLNVLDSNEKDIATRESLAQLYRKLSKVPEELFHQGVVYYYKKDYKRAKEVLNFENINTFSELHLLYYYRGLVELEYDEKDAAIEHFEASINEDDNYYPAYIKLATTLQENEQKDEAVTYLSEYLKRNKKVKGKADVQQTLDMINKSK